MMKATTIGLSVRSDSEQHWRRYIHATPSLTFWDQLPGKAGIERHLDGHVRRQSTPVSLNLRPWADLCMNTFNLVP